MKLTEGMKRLIERHVGLPIEKIREMSAIDLDAHIEKKIGKPLRVYGKVDLLEVSYHEDVERVLRKMRLKDKVRKLFTRRNKNGNSREGV